MKQEKIKLKRLVTYSALKKFIRLVHYQKFTQEHDDGVQYVKLSYEFSEQGDERLQLTYIKAACYPDTIYWRRDESKSIATFLEECRDAIGYKNYDTSTVDKEEIMTRDHYNKLFDLTSKTFKGEESTEYSTRGSFRYRLDSDDNCEVKIDITEVFANTNKFSTLCWYSYLPSIDFTSFLAMVEASTLASVDMELYRTGGKIG